LLSCYLLSIIEVCSVQAAGKQGGLGGPAAGTGTGASVAPAVERKIAGVGQKSTVSNAEAEQTADMAAAAALAAAAVDNSKMRGSGQVLKFARACAHASVKR